ncbi:aminotransferase class III-fold pyridoxal phosphate-dependent enzyme [Streptomyces coeruleoprunus]|uniref:Diaminobutyrate--2-oxoglutarate transaminase n=1 Tax=Streptomyces coeruleoprunus TaxID=285563 RepID=A0ABV9XMN2_9ACTN
MAVTEPAPVTPSPAGQEGILRRQSLREPAARTYARSLPVVPVRARGLTIEGADGRRYLDCQSGGGTLALGHNHPVVLEAIKRVIDSEAPLHAPDLATPVKDLFTTELFATLPGPFAADARIEFCGPAPADAVEAARDLVTAATGRSGLFPLTERSWNALEGRRADPAAVIVEPVAHEEVVPASDAWLRRIRETTSARAVPLIADESRTGVGRTGAFWGVEHSGVVPDVMVLSRAIGGSLPLAAIVYRAALDRGRPRARAGTFPGNQLAMAAGAATLAHVRENGLAERAAVLGARMLDRLRDMTAGHPCVREVRGRGLMIGVEFTGPAIAAAVRQECLRRGLIVEPGGGHCAASAGASGAGAAGPGAAGAAVVRLLPPLTITDEQAAAVLDRFADALEAHALEAASVRVVHSVIRLSVGSRRVDGL